MNLLIKIFIGQISNKKKPNNSIDSYSMGNGYVLISLIYKDNSYYINNDLDKTLFLEIIKSPIKVFKGEINWEFNGF